MGKTTGYSIASYGAMVADAPRMDAYAAALQQAVTPGCTVLDIGAGPGIASLLAARNGAARVVAVDPDDSIELLAEAATANGVGDRIEIHKSVSTTLVLDPPADVMVSDLRGVLPLLQHHIPSIVDARKRLLKQGGVQIPQRDRLFAAPVEHAGQYAMCENPWARNDYDLDLASGRPYVVNQWWRVVLGIEHLMAEGQCWSELDYTTVEDTTVVGDMEWQVARDGVVHGWLLWFDAELLPGIGYSNAPGQPELVYGQAFFPVEQALLVRTGDRLRLQLQAKLVGSEYLWRWDTHHLPVDESTAKTVLRQSTFHSVPGKLARLRERAPDSVPLLSAEAGLDHAALGLLDGSRALGDVAAELMVRFPQRFATADAAREHLATLCARYR